MKKTLMIFILTLACMGMGTGTAFTADKTMTKEEKDECLLISEKCKNISMSLQEKMNKLQVEIKKGKRVYTAEELKNLEQKLKEVEDTLDKLNENPYAR